MTDSTNPAELAAKPPGELKRRATPPSSRVPAIIVSVMVAAVAALSIWYLVRGEPLLVQGEVDATRLDLAARVDGRVAEIPVVRGQNVDAAAVLVRIDNPETLAKNEQALSATRSMPSTRALPPVGVAAPIFTWTSKSQPPSRRGATVNAASTPRPRRCACNCGCGSSA